MSRVGPRVFIKSYSIDIDNRGTFMEEHIPGLIEVFYKVDKLLSECGLS